MPKPPRKSRKKPASPSKRMGDYRARLRAQGLRPVQLWLYDTRSAAFRAEARHQAKAIGAHDPAGAELDAFNAVLFAGAGE